MPAVMGPTGLTVTPQDLPKLQGDTPSAMVKGLQPDRKASGEYVNVYDVDGEPHVAQFSMAPLNYQDDAGEWLPIDATLKQDGNGGYTNAAAGFSLGFPAQWSKDSPVTFSQDGMTFSEWIDGSQPSAVKQSGAQSVTYTGAATATDVEFDSTNSGSRQVITLTDASAGSTVTEDITTTGGMQLELQQDGSISLVDAKGANVGSIPAPSVSDSGTDPLTGDPNEGPVSYQLSGGDGSYQLLIVVDPSWLAGAKFPVTIDPTTVTPSDSMDTYVDDAHTSSSYGGSATLNVKAQTSSNAQHAFLNFPVGTYFGTGVKILQANVQVYSEPASASSIAVNLRRVTGGWSNSTTWTSAPSMDSTVYDTVTTNPSHWATFTATSLYQKIFDVGTNDGVALVTPSSSSNNQVQFASRETSDGALPALTVIYDQPPSAPTLDSPGTGGPTLSYGSPTLAVNGPSTDPEGDDMTTLYQIASDSAFSNIVTSGSVGNGDSWTVPSGVLQDGQTYYWRAEAVDQYNAGTYSGTRSFSVTIPHYGDDSRWAMWSDTLGNGMEMKVNQATGNLYLNYPLDSIDSPAGSIDLGLTYNSLDNADIGEGRGWVLSAGEAADAFRQPVSLGSSNDALIIKQRDGGRVAFTNQAPGSSTLHSYVASGADAGTITEDDPPGGGNAQYTYEPNDGGRYVFDYQGHLTDANPATSDDGKAGFKYTYTSGLLTKITEPLGRTVEMTYNVGGYLTQIQISSPGSSPVTRTWTIDPTGLNNEINSVTDPMGNVVTFGYHTYTSGSTGDGKTYLVSAEDGGSNTWTMSYVDPNYTSVSAPMMQASTVTDPGTYNTTGGGTAAIPATTFTYHGEQTGYIVNSTDVTDPNGNITTTQFDTQGFPILIDAPQESINTVATTPQTTMMWDQNGNLICKRGPAANAYLKAAHGYLGCVIGHQNPDSLQTNYTFETESPFLLEQKMLPAQKPTGTGSGPTTTYNYDEGMTGALQENFDDQSFGGVADNRSIPTSYPLTEYWGAGNPAGVSGNWGIRWTGRISITTQHTYHFRVYASGGVRLIVAGKVLLNCPNANYDMSTYNCGSNTDRTIAMWPDTPRIVLEYEHTAGHNGQIDTQWDGGTGSWGDIAGTRFDPDLNLLTSETNPAGLTTTNDYGTLAPRGLPATITTSDGSTSREEDRTYDDWAAFSPTPSPPEPPTPRRPPPPTTPPPPAAGHAPSAQTARHAPPPSPIKTETRPATPATGSATSQRPSPPSPRYRSASRPAPRIRRPTRRITSSARS